MFHSEIYVERLESQGSVLGFIPTEFPAGFVMAEAWCESLAQVVKVTGFVEDVNAEAPSMSAVLIYDGRDALDKATVSLITRAKAALR